MDNFYYETEFEEQMLLFFNEKYNLKNLELEEYLVLRYMILNKIKDYKKIKSEHFMEFIAMELNIDSKNSFTYKNSQFYVNSATHQSISNIVEGYGLLWKHLFGKFYFASNNKLNIISHQIIKTAVNKSKYKPKDYKVFFYEYFALNELNKLFNINPQYVFFENVTPTISTLRTKEEICEIYIKDMSFDTFDSKTIKEKDIEEFLFKNLSSLLSLNPIQRQYVVENDCICDIYAKDNETPVLIELKNTKDDRLLWQIVKYQKNMPHAKILVISTYWENTLLEELKKLNNVKTYKARPHILMGKIDKLDLIEL